MKQVKDIIIHNQVKNLSSLYVMLFSSLSPTVVQRRDGGSADVVECGMTDAVKGAVEVTLIDICNQLSNIVKDDSRWSLDKRDEDDYNQHIAASAQRVEAQMLAQLLADAKKADSQTTEKKGGTDEQK
jgi:hypothetical protein